MRIDLRELYKQHDERLPWDHIDVLKVTDSQLRYGGGTIATLSSPEKRGAASS